MRDRIVKQYDNGLKLIYKRNTSKEAAYFEFRFFSGLNNDPKDKLGLAHFVEHSAGFSNNKYTRQEKSDYRMKLYYANFSTGRNSMRFYAYVSDEEFEDVFAHYVNSITDFTIPQDEFDNEKKVINQEILRFRKNLSNEMSYTIRETFYNEVNDIRIRPFGTVETVENITKQDLEAYIKKCFVLENCQLTIYGNIPYYKIKRLIKKIVIPAFSKESGTKFLKPNQTILYTKNAPLMVVNPSPDEGKSQVRILHKIDLSNIDRYRGYAVSLLNSIYETATHEYFRSKFGLCYASSIRFYRSVSINNDYDILEMNIAIDCDQAVVKTVLEKVPEFYEYLREYPINEESVEKTKTTLRQYEKCNSDRNFIQHGETMADCEFNENIYYTYKQNKRFKKKREKMSADFVKDIFKTVMLTKPFVFVVSNTQDTLTDYEELCTQIKNNSSWIENI